MRKKLMPCQLEPAKQVHIPEVVWISMDFGNLHRSSTETSIRWFAPKTSERFSPLSTDCSHGPRNGKKKNARWKCRPLAFAAPRSTWIAPGASASAFPDVPGKKTQFVERSIKPHLKNRGNPLQHHEGSACDFQVLDVPPLHCAWDRSIANKLCFFGAIVEVVQPKSRCC